MRSSLPLILFSNALGRGLAYTVPSGGGTTNPPARQGPSAVVDPQEDTTTRRHALAQLFGVAGAAFVLPQVSRADVDVSGVAQAEMKEFVDPYGFFSISVPEGFFTLRRKSKGDLPDEKTGKGRRGSSIFTAGNMAKAEVIAVERYVSNSASCCCVHKQVLCDGLLLSPMIW